MWSLEYPVFLLLVPLVAGIVYLAHFWRKRGGRLPFNLGLWQGSQFRPAPGYRKILALAARILFWMGFLLLLFALSGPLIVRKKRRYLSEGVRMVLAVDVSPSMSAKDSGHLTRFEAARGVIKQFLAGRENDEIGLVVFGKEAALRVPPTLSYRSLGEKLDTLRIMEMGDGTAIGMGIIVAALHLNGGDEPSGGGVIILMTDGDNNAGEISPSRAARQAAALGIRIYTIGIGREGKTHLEFTDPKTGKEYRGTYTGEFNESLLKDIAQATGGRYFRAGSFGVLQTIFDEIDALEKTEKRVEVIRERIPNHRSFVLVGLILILIELGVRKFILGEVL